MIKISVIVFSSNGGTVQFASELSAYFSSIENALLYPLNSLIIELVGTP